MKNYALGHAINSKELFSTFPTKKLHISGNVCEKITGDHRPELCIDVFKACLKLVLDDIIDNNATFNLPTNAKKCQLKMKRFDGEDFVKCRQAGKFSDINFLKSNFTGYQIHFYYQNGGVERNKPIYVDKVRKAKITNYTNEGKSYY